MGGCVFVSVLTEMKTKSCTVFYTCFVCEQTHTHTHVYRQSHTTFTHPPTWYEVKRKKSTSTFSHPMFCDVARDVLLALPQPLPLCCLTIIPTALHAGRALLTLARRHARLHCRMTTKTTTKAGIL